MKHELRTQATPINSVFNTRLSRLVHGVTYNYPDPPPTPESAPAPAPAAAPAAAPAPASAPEGFVSDAEVEGLRTALAKERETADRVRAMEQSLKLYTEALGTLTPEQAAEIKAKLDNQKTIDDEAARIKAELEAEYNNKLETVRKESENKLSESQQQIQTIQREQALAELFALAGKPGEYGIFKAVAQQYIEYGEDNKITKFKNGKGENLLVKNSKGEHIDAGGQDFLTEIQLGNYGDGMKATLQPYNKATAHLVTGSSENGDRKTIVRSSTELAQLMSTPEGSELVRNGKVLYQKD